MISNDVSVEDSLQPPAFHCALVAQEAPKDELAVLDIKSQAFLSGDGSPFLYLTFITTHHEFA
jgi:hypothetical protein